MTYTVKLTESYEDGHEWEWEGAFTASRPDVAVRRALEFNRRSGFLEGHGRMVGMTVSAVVSR